MSCILSLCEMSYEDVCHCFDDGKTSLYYDSVYLGSEFCWDKLDVIQDWENIICNFHKKGYKVYFVFPILTERFVDSFKELFVLLVKGHIDGVVANDYGVLYYIFNQASYIPLVIGRLLIKSSRDYMSPKCIVKTHRLPQEIVEICHMFKCIRIDVDFGLLTKEHKNDLDIEIGIHSISYLTSSMCCDYKFNEVTKYAKIDSLCNRNCLKEVIIVPNSPLIKLGNALLFYQYMSKDFYADKIIVDYRFNHYHQLYDENNGSIKS